MPIPSSQISGMVGGQMAMFSNQAQFSQQIGGAVGTAPMSMAGGMQNPYPREDTGAQVAGGLGMALPGAATGLGVAGMVMGGKMGWMDPMTAGARGFAGGVGAGGAGFTATLGQVGRTFASGGLRAGLGALGGGVAGAAAAAAPALAIGAGLQFVGENIYQGAQNIAEVGGMANQYFGPQYGQAGARPGGRMGRQEIKRVTEALREIVDDDTRTSMEELKRVMDQAGRMGMLSGIGSSQEFKQKFQGMVRQMRQIADFMGTSLEEVAPLMGQMRQMGLWTAGDVMGTLTAGRVAGAAQPQMMQAMQTGAQMSHMMGGGLRAGAMTGRATFETVQAARRGGFLSEQDVAEFTGGLTGAEGQRAVAQQMTGIMSRLGQTPGWRLMMAGLGETEEGRFTGEVDPEKLRQFQSGGISINELQRMGRQASRTRGGALSFHRVQHRLAQNMASRGGLEAFNQIVGQVADRFGGDREEVTHRLLMQMGNMNEREAEMMQRLLQDLPQIRDRQARAARDAIDQAFNEAERKAGRGWDAFKVSLSRQWEEVKRPFQEMGERLATDFGLISDEMGQFLSDRVRRIPMGTQERMRLMQNISATEAMEALPQNMGQAWATGDWQSNMNARMRGRGWFGMAAQQAAVGAAVGSAVPILGTIGGGLIGGAAGLASAMFGLGEESTPRQQALRAIGAGVETGAGGDIELGGGVSTTRTRMEQSVRRAFKRAQSPTASALGIKDENKLSKYRTYLSKVIGKHSRELATLKKENPKAYVDRILKLMRDEAGPDAREFTGDRMEQLDYLAAAQQQEGFGASDLAVDFKGMARDVGLPPQTPEEMAKAQAETMQQMVEAGGGVNIGKAMLEGAAVGAAGAGLATGGFGALIGGIAGAAVGGIGGAIRDTGIRQDQIEQALTGAGSDIFTAWASGEMSIEEARVALTRMKGGDRVRDLLDRIEEHGLEDKFQSLAPQFVKLRAGQAYQEGLQDIRGIATGTAEKLRGVGATTQVRYQKLRNLLMGRGEGKDPEVLEAGEYEKAIQEAKELASSLTGRELQAIRGQRGGISGMLQAIRAAEDVTKGRGAIKGRELTALKKKFRGLGYDIEQLGGEDMAELLRDGISTGERGEFEEELMKIASRSMAGTAEGAKSHTERMNELLMNYTRANTDFVKAVHAALGDEIADAKDKLVKMEQGKIEGT